MREEMLGGLRARVTGGSDRQGGGDGPALILLHGFGAPGDDLVPLWRVLDVPRETRFVFPEAPRALPPMFGAGRAWWMIDLERIARVVGGGGGDNARLDDEPVAGLAEARDHVSALVDEVEARLGAKTIFLGGFSQGAMLACDVALHRARAVAGLALLSGTLITASEWRARAKALAGVRVLQSHGREDPLLPFAAAERLRDLLTDGGALVEWLPFSGGHQIPERALDRLAALVRAATP